MAVVTAEAQQPDLREAKGWRRTKNRIMTTLMVVSFILVIIPLGFVLFTVIAKGASIISWSFLTSGPIASTVAPAGVGGMGPAVLGTIEITALATVMAVPLGILGAVYLKHYGGKNWLAALIGFMSDVMTGVPSIIMGLFIFTIWVLHFGLSSGAGAFALGCLMLPIVIRSSYEMLRLVPNALREGSYALGATRGTVTVTVVLSTAIGGIVSGSLLAVARAAGGARAAAFLHRRGGPRRTRMCSAAPTGAALADLREREPAVRRRAGPRLGRGAHPDRHLLHPHDRGPPRHRPIRQVLSVGRSWKTLSRTEAPASSRYPSRRTGERVQLPEFAALRDAGTG